MDSLFGEDFNIDITKTKAEAKRIAKQLEKQKLIEEDPEKYLKSKALSLTERLAIIKERVLNVLGKQVENTICIRTLDDFKNYIDKAIKAGVIAVDTETNNSLDPVTCKLMGLCLYVPGEKHAYIPVNHTDLNNTRLLDQLTEKDCKNQLQRLIDNKIFIVMHNGKFDYEVIKCTCDIDVLPNWDTMIAAKLIDENEQAGLKYLYVNYIDKSQEKYDIEDLFENIPYNYVAPNIFALYAASDSFMTLKLYDYQRPILTDIKNKKLFWVFSNIEMPLLKVTADMELLGCAIDLPYATRLKERYNIKLAEVDKKIETELTNLNQTINEWRLSPEANEKARTYVSAKSSMTPEKITQMYPYIDEENKRYKIGKAKVEQLSDPINLASPSQLAILFYDILKISPVSKKSPRGTGEEELTAIAEKYPDLKICSLLLERRGLVKLISTYLEPIPALAMHWPDHRVRAHQNQMGTNTGRYSSGGKIKFTDEEGNQVVMSGCNTQNIPSSNADIRLMFKASYYQDEIEDKNSTFEISEISEIETPSGYKFGKDLIFGDQIITDEGIKTISNISYNNKFYTITVA